jgi:hypothetical protein
MIPKIKQIKNKTKMPRRRIKVRKPTSPAALSQAMSMMKFCSDVIGKTGPVTVDTQIVQASDAKFAARHSAAAKPSVEQVLARTYLRRNPTEITLHIGETDRPVTFDDIYTALKTLRQRHFLDGPAYMFEGFRKIDNHTYRICWGT